MNTYQALRVLNVDSSSSQEQIKAAYRKMALEVHPDKIQENSKDEEFKKITEAYNHLKKNYNQRDDAVQREPSQYKKETDFKKRPQWGAPQNEEDIPQQDWSKYTREFEEGDPSVWREYEKRFWEEYNARARADGRNGEYQKAQEPKVQPDLFVNVDKSLCIGCCSCEIIAPGVFEIDKSAKSNPKSSVIDQKGEGVNKIMNAAETCPTKAIKVENLITKEKLFPY